MAKILAVGGAGFIGSYIVRELLSGGHDVDVVDTFSKYGFLRHEFFSDKRLTYRIKDVRSMHPIEFRGYDHILFLAALIGGIKYFHKIPYQIARDNTESLSYAIDCTLSSSPDATFFYFSSSMVYERMERPVTEGDVRSQPVPITNYGMQKLFGEFLITGANEEFGLNYLIVRPFNAVGSGELPEVTGEGAVEFGIAHVIPDFVYKAIIKQTPFQIFGDGAQVRTFTHAKDIASAILALLQKGVKQDDFNICGNNTYSISSLARRVWTMVNPRLEFPGFQHLPAPAGDVRFRVGVSEKIKEAVGWTPKYEIDYVVEDTLNFLKKWMAGSK